MGFEEIRKVADLLGEKMTDEEVRSFSALLVRCVVLTSMAQINEMLDFASDTQDSRVGLAAFERIMVDVRAV